MRTFFNGDNQYLGMKRFFLMLGLFLCLFSVFGSEGYAVDTWVSNSTMVLGLDNSIPPQSPESESHVTPEAFYVGSSLRLISGDGFGRFWGFKWDGTQWNYDTSVDAGLPDIGDYSSPEIFYIGSTLYMIAGEDNDFFGYYWSGSSWVSSTGIISGLPGYELFPNTRRNPTVFDLNGKKNLIYARYDGTYYGYTWTGSTWASNGSLISGLTDVGSIVHPEVYEINNNLYMIVGTNAGTNYGYYWNDTTWILDSGVISGVGSIGGNSAFTKFSIDSNNYLIGGNINSGSGGDFFGFQKIVPPEYCVPQYEWKTNNTLLTSLPSETTPIKPTAYIKDDVLYSMISYADTGVINVYQWNDTTSQWSLNASLNDGLSPIGTYDTYPSPTVFFYSGWKTIIGSSNGNFYGYYWTGTEWATHTIAQGLPNIDSNSAPVVFDIGEDMYLIAGNSDGEYRGFKYVGTYWVEYPSIVSGLSISTDFVNPSVYTYNGTTYLIFGDNYGDFYNYEYVEGSWNLIDINGDMDGISASLTTPTTFIKNDIPNMIVGSYGGDFYGFTWGVEGYEENISCTSWSECNISNQTSRTCIDVCNFVETTEVKSCEYCGVTQYTAWSDCNPSNKSYRTAYNYCGFIEEEEQACVYDFGECVPDIECSEWSECNVLNKQSRYCEDNNECVLPYTDPQSCVYVPTPCVPVMECTVWSDCNPYNQSIRTCYDTNDPKCVDDIPESIYCEYTPPVCVPDVTCGAWSFCNPFNNLQTRTCVDATPDCYGTYTQTNPCVYVTPSNLQWYPDSSVILGLPDDDLEVVPSAYIHDGTLRTLLSYANSGIINVYDWSNSLNRWDLNEVMDDGLSPIGTYETNPKPSVFYWDGDWRTIIGSLEGDFYGYTWNGTDWYRDYWIVQGLPTGGHYRTAPAIFFKDGSYKMIFGDSNGAFTGYRWNDSIWAEQSILESNLPNVGQHSTPSVFKYGYDWYLVAGNNLGYVYNFLWDEDIDMWVSVSTMDNSVPDVGSYTAPTTYILNDVAYMFTGDIQGNFYGYSIEEGVCDPTVTCGAWSSCNSSSQQSRTCESECDGVTTEIQSCIYDPTCITNFACGSWSICYEAGWQTRTCTDLNECPASVDYAENQTCTPYIPSAEYEWVVDNSIINYLPEDGLETVPSAYDMNGTLSLMVAYALNGVINVQEWSDSLNRWSKNDAMNDGISTGIVDNRYPKPTVYYWEGAWRTIIGSIDGDFYGYMWDGTQWNRDYWIVQGLIEISTRSSPAIFYKDGAFHMIHGSVDGTFKGYDWDGSTWSLNTQLIAGLPIDIGTYSIPTLFEFNDEWYLVAGEGDGVITNYVLTDDGWQSVESMDDSLTKLNGNSAPTTFVKSGIPYMISGTLDGTFYGYRLSEVACIPSITCSEWSECFMEIGVLKKQRICEDANNCTATYTEKVNCVTAIEIGDDFYAEDEPDTFYTVPIINIPSTESNSPNINSQTITGFACFPNWYGFGDEYFEKMEYTIENITKIIYPSDSIEPCGKGLECDKPYGYIQTWDYLDKYFTQYDDYSTSITVTCYGNGTSNSLTLDFDSKEEDYCYTTDDTVTKECFSFNDKMDNHIYSATDLNLKPTFAFDLDRVTPAENTPDWQMYRVTTDVVNYFSSEAYINTAKNAFNKINQKEGYQIIELFATPEDEAQVYFDFMTEDIYPKYFAFTDSNGQVQILIMFYNNEVYYFDGYMFKSMGAYSLNTPYTVEVDFDVDNQRFKLGLNTWHLYLDDTYNVYSWKKIGNWAYNNKIGTFVTQIDDSKDIKYMAVTLMGEYCNSDADCSSVSGSPYYYAGTSSISPAFSDWGYKQVNEHLHNTDGSYLRYFDDDQSGNTGIVTINTWDDLESGVFNDDSLLSVVWESEGSGWFCYGAITKTVDVYARQGTGSWEYQDTMSITTASSPQTYSRLINISFDQIKFEHDISGGTCIYSSRGSIDFDSVRVTNITAGIEGECRDIGWFSNTFTNTSGNLEWAFDKAMNNSDFMLEWDDDIYTNLKLDRDTWSGGYCYADMLIDNVETFTTRSTFHATDEDSKTKTFTYEWLTKLGWKVEGNQDLISGDSGAYVSGYYDWSVCTEDGREYNAGTWCMFNVHIQVLWDIVVGSIYGNFSAFLMFILLLVLLASIGIMFR